MRQLDADIRIAALETVVVHLLVTQARQQFDPAGSLDALAAELRRRAETQPLRTDDEPRDRMALAGALLQLVALTKEKLITG